MKFGKIENPLEIDFKLPSDAVETKKIVKKSSEKEFIVFVGCAKWNKTDLKGFYNPAAKLQNIIS